MKKLFTLLCALLLTSLSSALCEAAPDAVVYVSITDDTGALVLAAEPVPTTDLDGDGACTINDVLIAAHEAHPEGAAAYTTAETQWGLSMLKLWGVENGGSYGYYLNDAMADGLLTPVSTGDHVKAYAFTDLAAFSDTYCYFDALMVAAAPGEPVMLTLTAAAFDENFAPVTLPVEGAVLLVDGAAADAVTDAEGKAELTFAEAGCYVVSAGGTEQNLVAPVCVVTVK